jgi:hypothetical protein
VHLAAALAATTEATDHLLARSATSPADMLAGAMAYLDMMALTTAAEGLAAGALSARVAGDPLADEAALLARFFATNRLAAVPALLAAVTSGAADLTAARGSIFS